MNKEKFKINKKNSGEPSLLKDAFPFPYLRTAARYFGNVMAREIWKDVEGYEGFYQVSNMVKVRSWDRTVKNWPSGKRLIKGRMLKPAKNKAGYLTVNFCNGGGQVNKSVHRLIAETFIPNPNNCPQINHKNGIKTDNRVENLEWCSCKHNMKHAYKNGLTKNTFMKGEKNSRAKLTKKQVIEIKLKLLQGLKGIDLAKEYNVSRATITYIKSGKNWKEVV